MTNFAPHFRNRDLRSRSGPPFAIPPGSDPKPSLHAEHVGCDGGTPASPSLVALAGSSSGGPTACCLDSGPVAPTSVPTVAPPPTPAGFRTPWPWVVGALYTVVPSGPLLLIAEPDAVEARKKQWYAITRGLYVGVTLSNSLAVNAFFTSEIFSHRVTQICFSKYTDQTQKGWIYLRNGILEISLDPPDLQIVLANSCRHSFPLFLVPTFVSRLSMTQDTSDEYADEEILNLIAALNLAGPDSDLNLPTASLPQTPPQTPSHRPPPYTTRSTFRPQPETRDSPGTSTLYYYESPRGTGTPPNGGISSLSAKVLSAAGNATQGISGGHVHVVQQRGPRKNKKKKTGSWRAYVVFCRRQCGVFLTWAETERLVKHVPNNIHRGYKSVAEANTAFEYLPQRVSFALNTLGVSGAVHESVKGKIAALRKYTMAVEKGDVGVVAPTYYPF
ncbi:hypothetical protein B0H13DRAFT_1919607 [Mycena leptocephala]|nr:hypothetical protein B0H13DRAFT_1919607 [Mycena leptocephala]